MLKECVRISEKGGKLQESFGTIVPLLAALICPQQTLIIKTVKTQTRGAYVVVPAIQGAALGLVR